MNWYKTSKLIDKDPSENSVINSACSYCDRWATNPVDEYSDDIVWKKEEELDHEEKKAVEVVEQQPFSSNMGISHGICPYCSKVLKMYNYRVSPKKVREISLSLT